MKKPIINALSRRSVLSIAALVLGAGVFVAACTESALVAPETGGFEEDDIMARTMALPSANPTVFVIVENPPELIGGLKGLQDRIEYPVIALKAGIEGRVFLQFIVQPDGTTSDIIVTRGIGGGCDEEAVRVVREARFIPGVQDKHRVPVKMSLTIPFRANPPEPSEPVDIALVKRQIEDGTYEFTRATWIAVIDATVTGTVLDRDGNPVTEGSIVIEPYNLTFPLYQGGRYNQKGRYRLELPAGTWGAVVKTPNAEWEETFILTEKARITRDLREPEK